jgi:nucleotide-binding universal stress UspA family protein
MFENILVCLDGFGFSEAILPLVAELAEHFNSKVILLHVIVVPTIIAGFGEMEINPTQLTQPGELEEEMNPYLEGISETLSARGLDVGCVTVEGTIEESIITYARTYNIGLIALVTHDHSALSRFILGSTTDIILRKSGIPILVICPDNAAIFNSERK